MVPNGSELSHQGRLAPPFAPGAWLPRLLFLAGPGAGLVLLLSFIGRCPACWCCSPAAARAAPQRDRWRRPGAGAAPGLVVPELRLSVSRRAGLVLLPGVPAVPTVRCPSWPAGLVPLLALPALPALWPGLVVLSTRCCPSCAPA